MKNVRFNKKKFNYLVMALIVLISAVFITGCSKADISSAKLLGYDNITFNEAMDKMVKDMMNDEVSSLSKEWKNGWAGEYAPDETVLNSNEKAMTYVLSIKLDYEGKTETNRMIFYFIHDLTDNTLSVQGGLLSEDGDEYPMSLSEAREGLEEMFDEYN